MPHLARGVLQLGDVLSNPNGGAVQTRLARSRIPAVRRIQLSGLRRIWHDYGLSISLILLFAFAMLGQTLSGWRVYNDEQREHGEFDEGRERSEHDRAGAEEEVDDARP